MWVGVGGGVILITREKWEMGREKGKGKRRKEGIFLLSAGFGSDGKLCQSFFGKNIIF